MHKYLLAFAIIAVVVIIYFHVKRVERKISACNASLIHSENLLNSAASETMKQDTLLAKCQGDQGACDNKTITRESEMTALSADLEAATEKISQTYKELQFYKELTFALKKAIDDAPYNFNISAHMPQRDTVYENAERLMTRIADQQHLIRQMHGELLDRRARINVLGKKLLRCSGMY